MTGAHTHWFVAVGLAAGNGSRERPFHDPWVALRHAGPGDTIHIAAGSYFGRYQRSSWAIDAPDLTVLGGYSADFTTRTPWHTPTILAGWAGATTPHEANMLQGVGGHDGVTLDGLFFDAAGRNEYDEGGALRSSPYGDGPIVSLRAERATVRNCIFANGAAGAAEIAGNGCRFENNLMISVVGSGLLTVRDSDGRAPIVVARNTFCFAHDDSDPPRGTGADKAIGVRIYGAAMVEENVFVGCGNAAISIYRDVDRITINRNLFFLTFRDVVRSRAISVEAEITEAYLDEIEDVGLQSAIGNGAGDPHLTGLPSEWVDAYTRDATATYARPPVAALDALRASAGLGPLADSVDGDPRDGGVGRLTPAQVLAVRSDAPQGFHPVDLPVPAEFRPRPPASAYQPIDWGRFVQADAGLAGARVELRGGLGTDRDITFLADAGPATHVGIAVYEPGTDDRPLYVLAGRHTLARRQVDEAIRYQRGLDVESTYLLRGIYRSDTLPEARQAATLLLESVAPALELDLPPASRPAGRNWFVRAGASGGDGTRDGPFRDPFQALEKAEGGDTIHVATGAYVGRLRSGAWRIPVRNLTLLGGYSDDFKTRDPWSHPARFVLNPQEKAKGAPSGPVLATEDTCDGLVLDGFLFDGSTYNTYTDDGSLDVGRSPTSALLDLIGGRGPITVRNCVFLNAASSSVKISSPCGMFDNNVVINTSGTAVRLRAVGAGPWIVRNNTVLFAADPTDRASSGQSTAGALLEVDGRAVVRVQSNVLAFADGTAIRATIPGQNLVLEDNVLAANLHADVSDGRYVTIHRANWERTAMDAPFASIARNTFDVPKLAINRVFAGAAIDRLATLPGNLPAELLRTAAAALGMAAGSVPTAPATEAAPARPDAEPSISDLLADLGRMREELATTEPRAEETAPAIVYCPAYAWVDAADLARGTPAGQPGVRTEALPVSFEEPSSTDPVDYRPVDAATIDAGPAALDGVAIVIEVQEARSGSTNPSLYPSGTTRDDHEAFNVTALTGPTRTRLVVVVRDDTATSKVFARLAPSDAVRVCGVGRVILEGKALAVVAHSAERH